MALVGIVVGAAILFGSLIIRRGLASNRGAGWSVAIPVALVVGVGVLLVGASVVRSAIVPTVQLATATDFSVLGGQSVTNTGPSVLGQSVGVSPGTSITGFPPGMVNAPGTIESSTPVAQQAQADLTTAYTDAAGRPLNATLDSGELGGRTLVGGVYAGPDKSPLTLTGTLTLDGQGDPNSVFIFQTNSTLITASSSTVSLINGAQECNVFWQVGSSATLGSGSTFVGNILALTSITLETGAAVEGRALARNGSVTLDNNVFNEPGCDVQSTPTTTPGGGATTTVPGGGATTTVPGGGATTTAPGGGATTTIATTGGAVGGSVVVATVLLAMGVAITFIARRGSASHP